MSGIYIHIPFCKQACHYCDFHFSTTMGKKKAMVTALCKELALRNSEFENTVVSTIYFGGGTPSVLETAEIQQIITAVYAHYIVAENPEITLEANPDDLSDEKIIQLSKTPVNRLSIGVQSFFEEDLKLMNRAHNVEEAIKSINTASKYFNNISIDLIYGMPNMSNQRWLENIETALSFKIPHISSYALTVEPNTALASFIKKGKLKPLDEAAAQAHFKILNETVEKAGFICYEISNFGKPGYFSENNTAYWQQKSYVGIGPSAHSFDGIRRGWNINNNTKYLKAIGAEVIPMETETLTKTDAYNEYIMTGLRTIWGVSLEKIKVDFGADYHSYLLKQADKFIWEELLNIKDEVLLTTKKGEFLADGIAADLFMVG